MPSQAGHDVRLLVVLLAFFRHSGLDPESVAVGIGLNFDEDFDEDYDFFIFLY